MKKNEIYFRAIYDPENSPMVQVLEKDLERLSVVSGLSIQDLKHSFEKVSQGCAKSITDFNIVITRLNNVKGKHKFVKPARWYEPIAR